MSAACTRCGSRWVYRRFAPFALLVWLCTLRTAVKCHSCGWKGSVPRNMPVRSRR